MTVWEVHEVHFLRPDDEYPRATHVVPFRRRLFATEQLAEAEKVRLDLRSSDPEVIAARRLVGIDSVEVRVGPVEVHEA